MFLLLFVMAFGVFWEVIEFALGEAARAVGNRALLTQYGLEDTMLDLVFDVVGAVLVVALDVRVFLGAAGRFPGASRLLILGGGAVLAGSVVAGLLVWVGPSLRG